MKNLYLLAVALLFSAMASQAQAPSQMNYQGIVRDAQGLPLTYTTVSIRFIIHDGSPAGPVVFTENNTAITNQFGLITQVIGSSGNLLLTGATVQNSYRCR